MQLSGFFRIIQPVSSFDKKAEMEVRSVLNALEDAYQERNLAKLDHALHLFDEGEQIETIGIGAYQRNGLEWFVGHEWMREIIAGDWEYWGNVEMDVHSAQINVHGEVAWISMIAMLIQVMLLIKPFPISGANGNFIK